MSYKEILDRESVNTDSIWLYKEGGFFQACGLVRSLKGAGEDGRRLTVERLLHLYDNLAFTLKVMRDCPYLYPAIRCHSRYGLECVLWTDVCNSPANYATPSQGLPHRRACMVFDL